MIESRAPFYSLDLRWAAVLLVVFPSGAVTAVSPIGPLAMLAAVVAGMIPALVFVCAVGAFHLFSWGGGRGRYLSRQAAISLRVAQVSAGVGIVLATLSLAGWLVSALGVVPAMPYSRVVYTIGYCLTTAALAFFVLHRSTLPTSWTTRPDLTGRHDSEWAQSLQAGIGALGHGRLADAENLFRAALDSPEARSIGGQVLAVSLDDLAAACAAAGRYAEAMRLYERSLPIWIQSVRSSDPDGDPDVAAALINLAGIYIAQEQHADAAALTGWASTILWESEVPETGLDEGIVELWGFRDAHGSMIPTPFGVEMAREVGHYNAIWRDLRTLLIDASSRLRLVAGRRSDTDTDNGVGPLKAHLDLLLRRLLGADYMRRAGRHLS